MNAEIREYIRIEAVLAAAFNFFINGMVVALLYHKADKVATDTLSIAADLAITCLCIFILTAIFCKASLRRTRTSGILACGSNWICRLSRLFRRSVLFGVLLGILTAVVIFALIAPVFGFFGLDAIPFGWYVALKSLLAALLGGGAAAAELYLGMCRAV